MENSAKAEARRTRTVIYKEVKIVRDVPISPRATKGKEDQGTKEEDGGDNLEPNALVLDAGWMQMWGKLGSDRIVQSGQQKLNLTPLAWERLCQLTGHAGPCLSSESPMWTEIP